MADNIDNGTDDGQPLTDLIQRAAQNEPGAKDALYNRLYDELRDIAHRLIRRHHANDLQTTALVNEVVLRFEKSDSLRSMANRRVFFFVATRAMNQILIDQYRRRKKSIDSPDRTEQPLDKVLETIEMRLGTEFGALHLELDRLATESPRQHSVIMHRFFAGLTIRETAELLEVSDQTVERDWRIVRAKLAVRLQDGH